MYYFNLRRTDENQTSVRPKRRWHIYVSIASLIGVTAFGGIFLKAKEIYEKVDRIEWNINELRIAALRMADAFEYVFEHYPEGGLEHLTKEKRAGMRRDLAKILGPSLWKGDRESRTQESEAPYQLELTITYPQN